MRIITAIFLSALLITNPLSIVFAYGKQNQPPLNKVIYNLSAEEWVATQSADVTVSIEATLNDVAIEKARSQILARLQQIAAGDWNITRFEPSQDSSGLERISVDAQARITQDKLNNLTNKAKAVSQAGATYRISSVSFAPSLAEIEVTRQTLRNKLYRQAKEELAQLNKIYPEQDFSLFQLNFIPGEISPLYGETNQSKRMAFTAAAPSAFQGNQGNIEVRNKIKMTALVMFAANRNLASNPTILK